MIIIVISSALALQAAVLTTQTGISRLGISVGVFCLAWITLTFVGGLILRLTGYGVHGLRSDRDPTTPMTGSAGPRSTSTRRPSFAVGPYRLDMRIEGLPNLREISDSEYLVMNREFRREKIFHADPVELFGGRWKVMLGTVQGQVFKVAPYFETLHNTEANQVAMVALNYCREQLGEPSEQQQGLFTWDTADGNVILQTAKTAKGFGINLFVTSNAVRGFSRS